MPKSCIHVVDENGEHHHVYVRNVPRPLLAFMHAPLLPLPPAVRVERIRVPGTDIEFTWNHNS